MAIRDKRRKEGHAAVQVISEKSERVKKQDKFCIRESDGIETNLCRVILRDENSLVQWNFRKDESAKMRDNSCIREGIAQG